MAAVFRDMPAGGHVEVFAGDIYNPRDTRRVFSRSVRGALVYGALFEWSREGIHAGYETEKGGWSQVVIDPRRRSARKLDRAAAEDELRWYFGKPNPDPSEERSHRHLAQRARQIFLWNPDTFQEELLVQLPLECRGHADPRKNAILEAREKYRYAQTIHQIRRVAAEVERDTVRVSLQTFVLMPGDRARRYRVKVTVDVPDSLAERRGLHGTVEKVVASAERTLGARPARVTLAIPMESLRRILRPHLQAAGWPSWFPYDTAIGVRLIKDPEPSDEGVGYPGILKGDWALAKIVVPALTAEEYSSERMRPGERRR